MTKQLSVAIICKDEKEMIQTCLESVKEADEIIICDTGSTDNTIQLIEEFRDKTKANVKIFTDYKWNDDYSEARNHCFSKCTKDWILTIDCDEKLDDGMIAKIKERIQWDNHLTINITMYSGNTSFKSPRLCINDISKVYYQNPWHNCLNVMEDNEALEIRMYYGYSPAHYRDPERCMRMATKAIAKNPDSSRLRFYYSRELGYNKKWQEAIDSFNKYFTMNPWPVEEEYAHFLCALYYNNLGNWKKAKDECFEALKLNPSHKACIEFLASLCGPGAQKRWKLFAESANDDGVLFKSE